MSLFELHFEGERSLAAVRAFLRDVVRLFRPELDGEWVEAKRAPRPHSFLPAQPDLARVDFTLEDATLVQVVSGDESGNPRDGFGYDVEFDLRLIADDGRPRRLFHRGWSWDPFPSRTVWRVEGCTPDELEPLRTLGAHHLGLDLSACEAQGLFNAEQLTAAGAHLRAREVLVDALVHPRPPRGPTVQRDFAALWKRAELDLYRLVFRTPARFEAIRPFLAEVVGVVTGGDGGGSDWQRVRVQGDATHFALGRATLIETVKLSTAGNGHDDQGHELAIELTVAGADGVPRELRLSSSSWDPYPAELHFKLTGFSPAEFFAARARGRERFGHDETDSPVWAGTNITSLVRAGARLEAAAAIDAALTRGLEPRTLLFPRQLARLRLAIAQTEPERRAAEAELLCLEPTNRARLQLLMRGDVSLPPWTPEAARAVSARLAPAGSELGALSQRWQTHPWWPGVTSPSLDGWSELVEQPESKAEPVTLSVMNSVRAIARALGTEAIADWTPAPGIDGEVVRLEGARVDLRAVVVQPVGERWWAWLWRDEVCAVLVFDFAPGVTPGRSERPRATHLQWCGPSSGAEARLRELSPRLRFLPPRA